MSSSGNISRPDAHKARGLHAGRCAEDPIGRNASGQGNHEDGFPAEGGARCLAAYAVNEPVVIEPIAGSVHEGEQEVGACHDEARRKQPPRRSPVVDLTLHVPMERDSGVRGNCAIAMNEIAMGAATMAAQKRAAGILLRFMMLFLPGLCPWL